MEKKLNYHSKEHIFREEEKNGVIVLKFPLFDKLDMVKHGISTRVGGVSEGYLGAMNLSFTRGDKEEHVLENYKRIAEVLEVWPDQIVCSAQTHTTNVRIVTREDAGKGVVRPKDYTDVDGLITNEPGICLATFYADCVPLLFADPVQKVVATSHSGWRGTVGKIGAVTVEKMVSVFGCDRANIIAGIGPSICQDCYEVSEDVIEQFQNAFEEKDHDQLFYRKENGKYQLNLWKANERILLDAGISPEHLAVSNLCTCCNPDLLFSHRASGGLRGNLAALIALA